MEEVKETIEGAAWSAADFGPNRMQCSREFPFDRSWNGKMYSTKRVRPIFVEDATEIVVITVYTYYG